MTAKDFSKRRLRAIDYIEGAIACLDKKDKDELQMVQNLQTIKQAIEDTIIYTIK